jgi:hypothetical protein
MWIDPILWSTPDRRPAGATDCDCLGLAEFDCAGNIPAATICLATVVSPGFEDWLDDMLGSFQAHGRCLDAVIAVYTFDESAEMRRIITRHGAYAIPCRMNQDAVCPTTSVLYSAARHVCADYYLCLDADLLVLGDLRPLTAAIDVLPPGTVLVGRDALPQEHLAASLTGLYGGSLEDFAKITGEEPGPEELNYPLVVNDGVLLARRAGLAALDEAVRGMPGAQDWIMKDPGKSWQNQFLLNLALARLNCGVELDESFNVQLNCREVVFSESCGRLSCRFNSRAANIVHFNGGGRSKYTEWRGRFR